MPVLTWLKDKALWIVGGIVLTLGIIFAVKFERKKIDRLKDKANKRLDEIHENDKKLAELEGQDKGLAKAEQYVEENIKELDKDLAKVEDDVEGRTADEVAARFNAMYGDSTRIRVNDRK